MSINLEKMTAGYIEAMAFTDCQPGDECADHDFSDELLEKAKADCAAFVASISRDVIDALAEKAADYTDERFGHDFWLTRNGHGAGFWDRAELEIPFEDQGEIGSILTRHAEQMGGTDLYVGDDGLIYAAL